MKNNFQIVFLAIFLAFFVFAVLIFGGVLPIGKGGSSSNNPRGNVVVWGTFSDSEISTLIDKIETSNKDLFIKYIRKDKQTYKEELISAFAKGNAPDLFFVSSDTVFELKDFIYHIPYTAYPEKSFRDFFIDGTDILLDQDGILALPVAVDPMVVYYNKDILANAGIAQAPSTWTELFNLNDLLTVRDATGGIQRSMIALGSYNNVNNAKDILATLILQGGNPITVYQNGKFLSALQSSSLTSTKPVEQALTFYNEFSTQSNRAYSWNRGLAKSRDLFTSGKLAFYLGHASELFEIESVNPNLSFDVREIFQTTDSLNRRTFGTLHSIAINKNSADLVGALGVATLLTSGENARDLSTALSLPPASRALLSEKPTEPYLSTFFTSAIITRSWIDPSGPKSDLIFNELVENILSNKLTVSSAISKADAQLNILFRQ